MIELMLSGGLGNQMFEYATARCLQLDLGGELIINTSLYGTDKYGRDFSLMNLKISEAVKVVDKNHTITRLLGGIGDFFPGLTYKVCSLFGFYIWRKRYYRPIVCKRSKNVLYGYFQSEKFFERHADVIKNELKVKNEARDINRKLLKSESETNSVCVHVRRGDYVTDGLIICDIPYYQKAINIICEKIPDAHFFVFSDDIEWTKEHIEISQATYVNNGNKDYEELQLMYNCKHFIICNSSFSWWAQYLSESEGKIVVAPNIWMPGETIRNDIFQDNWIRI